MSKKINIDNIDKSNCFNYLDENDFIKKMRSLKTYCPRAYKDLIFNIEMKNLHYLKDGKYQKDLYTSKCFKFVYGQIQLIFTVEKGNVLIEDLLPHRFFLDGYFSLLDTYKGMPYRDKRDRFKIDLFIAIKERSYAR